MLAEYSALRGFFSVAVFTGSASFYQQSGAIEGGPAVAERCDRREPKVRLSGVAAFIKETLTASAARSERRREAKKLGKSDRSA